MSKDWALQILAFLFSAKQCSFLLHLFSFKLLYSSNYSNNNFLIFSHLFLFFSLFHIFNKLLSLIKFQFHTIIICNLFYSLFTFSFYIKTSNHSSKAASLWASASLAAIRHHIEYCIIICRLYRYVKLFVLYTSVFCVIVKLKNK